MKETSATTTTPSPAVVVNANDARLEDAMRLSLERGELGVQVAAYVGNRLVIDCWAGDMDSKGTPVDGSTLFPVFSVTKAVTATALHIQAERGLIDYDKPVAAYWPEFGQNGKDKITVQQILSHQSGTPQMPDGVTPELMCDWAWMADAIAKLTPMFEPGTRNAYQAKSFGWLVGELVMRTDCKGRGFGQFVREEIADPLAIEDLYIGLPESELGRTAELVSDLPKSRPAGETKYSLAAKPPAVDADAGVHNRADVRMACLPGGGGIMSARGSARFFAMLANGGELDGVRLLSEERVRFCTLPRDHADRPDEVVRGGNSVLAMSKGGFWLDGTVFGGGAGTLCHAGSGGSAGFADMNTRFAVSICHNRLFGGIKASSPDHPFAPLAGAIRDTVAPYIASLT